MTHFLAGLVFCCSNVLKWTNLLQKTCRRSRPGVWEGRSRAGHSPFCGSKVPVQLKTHCTASRATCVLFLRDGKT